MAVLETRALCKSFGALQVAQEVDFRLTMGARHALIGPNGAGKTTFINLITGAIKPTSGRMTLNDEDITGLSQVERVKRGLARTFQINTLFKGLSVLENVCMSVSERLGARKELLRPMGYRRDVIDESLEIMGMLKLEDYSRQLVRELPYGQQRLVEIAIALGLRPKVLLLDEPAAGVPTSENDILLSVIDRLPQDIAVLIIDHDMDVVFRFARRITVMVGGRVLVEGSPEEISTDERVREVYLGRESHV